MDLKDKIVKGFSYTIKPDYNYKAGEAALPVTTGGDGVLQYIDKMRENGVPDYVIEPMIVARYDDYELLTLDELHVKIAK